MIENLHTTEENSYKFAALQTDDPDDLRLQIPNFADLFHWTEDGLKFLTDNFITLHYVIDFNMRIYEETLASNNHEYGHYVVNHVSGFSRFLGVTWEECLDALADKYLAIDEAISEEPPDIVKMHELGSLRTMPHVMGLDLEYKMD